MRALGDRAAKPKPGCADKRQRTNSSQPAAAAFWISLLVPLFRSESKPQKTPPSHDLTGLAAIKAGAKKSASWSARRQALFWQPRRFRLYARRFSRGRAAWPLAALRAFGGSGWFGLARGLLCKRLGAGCRAAGLAHRLALLFQLPGICALRLRLQAAHCIAARPAVLAMAGWLLPGRPVRRAACLHAAHRLAAKAGIQRIRTQLNRAAFVRGRARPVGIRQRAIRPPAFVGLPKSGLAHQRRRKQSQRTRQSGQKTHRHIRIAARQSAAFEKENGPENSTQGQADRLPENGSIARFQGLGRYQSESGFRPAARLLAFGFQWRASGCVLRQQPNGKARNPTETAAALGARIAACCGGSQVLSSRAAKPKAGRAGKWQRTNGCCGTLDFASFAPFSRANSSPKKRPHRRVSGTWVLSNQERIQACCAALGIRHSAFGIRLSVSACGFRQRAGLRCGLLSRLEAGPEPVHNGCGVLDSASFAHFSGANLRPRKRLYRTV